MPFLFWWNTWFGRHLSDQQLTEYLHDDKKPRHIQHALVQLGDRISPGTRSEAVVSRPAAPLHKPSGGSSQYRRLGMGQDTSAPGFHDALVKMLQDQSPMVRGNAALSLVRFGDSTGRPQIVALLQPAQITAPAAGTIVDADRPGTAIHQGGLVAKLKADESSQPLNPSPIPGRIRSVAQTGAKVASGTELAVIDPRHGSGMGSLRALYLSANLEDFQRSAPTSVMSLTSQTTSASKRRKPKQLKPDPSSAPPPPPPPPPPPSPINKWDLFYSTPGSEDGNIAARRT